VETTELAHSGFASLVGRPNVGKSTLLNRILGQKVTIVSDKPQTTRTQVRGVLNRPDAQIVFVDTPGIHRPRTALGERLNATASEVFGGMDVVCLVIDATGPVGPGDRFVGERVPRDAFVVVNKVDLASRDELVQQLARASEQLDLGEYFPVSAKTGEGVDALVDAIVDRLPPGPKYYPDDMVTDSPEAFWVAELVREQLLAVTRDELPHSIATRVTNWEETPTGPIIRVEILVERESQKGIVIGRGGEVLKQVGIKARRQMPPGTYLDLQVSVEKNWHHDPDAIADLGY